MPTAEQRDRIAEAVRDPERFEHIQCLVNLADSFHEEHETAGDRITTVKFWAPEAQTFTYHTHVATDGLSREVLDSVADAFYRAADLEALPWYGQFQGGASRPCPDPLPAGVDRHQLTLSTFDVGLSRPRCYRTLVCQASPRADMRVVSLLSVDLDWPVPADSVLAVTLQPTGDVFEWRSSRLHWHHICTTPGVGLLPGAADRWLLNGLRRFGLDGRERQTYRDEAEGWRRWLASGGSVSPARAAEGTR